MVKTAIFRCSYPIDDVVLKENLDVEERCLKRMGLIVRRKVSETCVPSFTSEPPIKHYTTARTRFIDRLSGKLTATLYESTRRRDIVQSCYITITPNDGFPLGKTKSRAVSLGLLPE